MNLYLCVTQKHRNSCISYRSVKTIVNYPKNLIVVVIRRASRILLDTSKTHSRIMVTLLSSKIKSDLEGYTSFIFPSKSTTLTCSITRLW